MEGDASTSAKRVNRNQRASKHRPFEKPCDRCEHRVFGVHEKVPLVCSTCKRFKDWFNSQMVRAKKKAQLTMKKNRINWAVVEEKAKQ